MSNPLAIRCEGLVKRYGELTAVNGLDLEVERGQCFGLLGPNGAGKTTTVEILEGLLDPTAGRVEVLGKRWATDEAWLKERIGISLQETQFSERVTVEENLTLFRSFYPTGPTVEDLLQLVSLEDKRQAWYSKLSGGQKQRLAVACALAGDPDILFLDEPTTGLDPQSRRQLWELVERFGDEGRSVLLTTHYMEEAERLCDRVAIVDHGKVIARGTPKELIASLGGTEVIEVECSPKIEPAQVETLAGVHGVRLLPDGVALTVKEVHVTLPLLLALLEREKRAVTRLSTHHATLEDVFVTLTGRQLRE